jgi:hypothetical protein
MSFSIRKIIQAFAAPNHKISCNVGLWKSIVEELHRRTQMRHESGAFLLGTEEDGKRRIVKAVYYDEVDPNAYDSGICIVKGPGFARLWEKCRRLNLTVVADVHVHPGAAFQSWSDKTNPVLPTKGHIAMIIANYAKPPFSYRNLGIFEYVGNNEWIDIGHRKAARFFYVGVLG